MMEATNMAVITQKNCLVMTLSLQPLDMPQTDADEN